MIEDVSEDEKDLDDVSKDSLIKPTKKKATVAKSK